MFKQITVIGVGLLGGSLALEVRRQKLADRIIGVCRSDKSAELALSKQIVDEVRSLEEAVLESDLVVLATPMQSMLPQLQKIQNLLPQNCILTDVGSVKEALYNQVKIHCPTLLPQFVFGHPIAGGENSGAGAAKLELFNGKHVVITPTPEVQPDYVQKVRNLWQSIGASLVEMTLQQHDAVFAKTSHLPHMIAFSLVNFLQQQQDNEILFDMAAAGFYDFTRIASSDAVMWRDICTSNQAEILDALDGFEQQLQHLRKLVSENNQVELYKQFCQAKLARDTGLAKKFR